MAWEHHVNLSLRQVSHRLTVGDESAVWDRLDTHPAAGEQTVATEQQPAATHLNDEHEMAVAMPWSVHDLDCYPATAQDLAPCNCGERRGSKSISRWVDTRRPGYGQLRTLLISPLECVGSNFATEDWDAELRNLGGAASVVRVIVGHQTAGEGC